MVIFGDTDIPLRGLTLFGMKKYSWHLNSTEWNNPKWTLIEERENGISVNQGPKNCGSRNLELPKQANKSHLM